MKIFKAFLVMVVFMLIFTGMTMGAEIHQAAKKGSLEKVKAFLANGEKVDLKDKHEMTPLYYAAVRGHKDVCEFLISQGADVNAGSESGFFPLGGIISTRTEGGIEIFKLLVDHGADYNINFGGYPLLHQAVYSCNNECVRNIAEFLISKGVDINAKGYQGKTPLHMVRCTEICGLLISKGADVNAKDNQGLTPLHQALKNKHKVVATLLKKHGGVE
jgi:ankyrin repeat protein